LPIGVTANIEMNCRSITITFINTMFLIQKEQSI